MASSWADYSEFLTALLWFLVFAWLFWAGGCVGSFMNVVVYRLPAGINLVHPGSRCPHCLHAIRWYHNAPILGWLILRGRCRDCRAPISPRYPLVEAAMACLFVLLAAVEILGEGANLPRAPVADAASVGSSAPASGVHIRSFASRQRMRHPIADTPERIWGVYAFHLLLACTLVCAALIEYDSKDVPWLLFVPALGVGIVAPLFWPELHPVSLSLELLVGGWKPGMANGAAGLLVGALLGGVIAMAQSLARPAWAPRPFAETTILPWMLCGLFLGWQAATAIGLLAALLAFANTLAVVNGAARRLFGWTFFATAPTLLFLFAWRALVSGLPWLGPAAQWPMVVASAVVLAIAALLAARFTPYTESAYP